MRNKNFAKKGQILLITVMLLATVMTIVLSISFKSVTETQVTKLEEESQKALAAAESAIDVALKENATATLGSGSLTSITEFTGKAIIDTTTSNKFISPSITKNGSYTFYLGNYDSTTKIIGASTAQNITLCFKTGTTKPAIEVTLVKTARVKKYVIDPDHDQSGRIVNASATSSCTPDFANYSFSTTIPSGDIGVDSKLLLVRVLYSSTKLLFNGDSGLNLPVQGRTVSSQATSSTSTGVSKKVVLFQSYPQIPAEFFTTTF
jgi:type II secretory pathway pseudopilin PulG